MKIFGKTLQALIIILIGNFNFFFIVYFLNPIDCKGIVPLIIFLPYGFTTGAMKLLFYDSFTEKIEKTKNRTNRIIFMLILILLILLIAIALQSGIYYCHYYYTTRMS